LGRGFTGESGFVMEMPRVGTDFAGYQVQGIVGRGGMSVVYQAEHPRLARIVALKVLALELAEDDRFRERFVRESRLAASLDHPNIIPIYDAGSSQDLLYIAMRFVKGDLKSVIQRDGRLKPERLMPVITQVASALDAAHHLGLVHRDVKPANILIAFSSGPDGQDHVYLADFGLTKHATSRSGITGTGQFVGTVDYMAPEQIEGKQVDGRVDVYALGCIVYECLTGRVPFTRDTDAAVIWAHLKEDPPKVSAVARNLPPEVDDVIAKAMGKNADDRYSSCMTFLADLRGAMALGVPRSQRASIAAPTNRETVLRERPGEVAAQSAPASPVAAPASVAATPEAVAPPEAPPQQPPVRPSHHDGMGESAASPPPASVAQPPSQPAPYRDPASPGPAVAPRADSDRRRGVMWAIAVIILVVGAGAALWYFFGDGSPGGNGERSVAATTAGALVARTTTDLRPIGAFPDAVESLFLVAHVGADNVVNWRCQRPESALEDAIRSLSCSPGGPVTEVTFALFHDGFRLRNFFNDLQESKGASAAGKCFEVDTWRGRWSIGPETWAHALGPDHGEYKGQVLCFKDSTGAPHISWIDYATKIYAEASGTAGDEAALYDWWLQEAGPGHPTHIHSLETGSAAAVVGENLASGSVVAVDRGGAGVVSSATLQASDGKETEIFFDPDITYECALSHVIEHQESGSFITVPVERRGGRLVVTHFTHC
jgi:serine/threonine protein kinase